MSYHLLAVPACLALRLALAGVASTIGVAMVGMSLFVTIPIDDEVRLDPVWPALSHMPDIEIEPMAMPLAFTARGDRSASLSKRVAPTIVDGPLQLIAAQVERHRVPDDTDPRDWLLMTATYQRHHLREFPEPDADAVVADLWPAGQPVSSRRTER